MNFRTGLLLMVNIVFQRRDEDSVPYRIADNIVTEPESSLLKRHQKTRKDAA